MIFQTKLDFNPKPSTIMHIDLNSCFATIEQQANPFLRGKPLGVAAYDSPNGCIVAPSIEAKAKGVRVGMRVKEGKMICPGLEILPPDPVKYRIVHLKLKNLLKSYTEKVFPKSIDEFELDLEGYPAYQMGIMNLGKEIKKKIKKEVGDWLTVSIGFGANRLLAKTAANIHKPDGLDDINIENFENVFKKLSLDDLAGIAGRNTARLNACGIHTVWDMYVADFHRLWGAFHSIVAYYWYLRLRGWEIDDVEWGRKSFGNSYSLPKQHSKREKLTPLLTKLVDKMSYRLRQNNYACQGVHYAVSFTDGTHWHKGMKTKDILFSTQDIYRKVFKLFCKCPYIKPVRNMAVSVFNLKPKNNLQLSLMEDTLKKESLYEAVDSVNERWGRFVITPARMINTDNNIEDRIAFGGVREIYDFISQ